MSEFDFDEFARSYVRGTLEIVQRLHGISSHDVEEQESLGVAIGEAFEAAFDETEDEWKSLLGKGAHITDVLDGFDLPPINALGLLARFADRGRLCAAGLVWWHSQVGFQQSVTEALMESGKERGSFPEELAEEWRSEFATTQFEMYGDAIRELLNTGHLNYDIAVAQGILVPEVSDIFKLTADTTDQEIIDAISKVIEDESRATERAEEVKEQRDELSRARQAKQQQPGQRNVSLDNLDDMQFVGGKSSGSDNPTIDYYLRVKVNPNCGNSSLEEFLEQARLRSKARNS